ncbi:hypothetical protein SEA_CAMERICO_73 [Gordonia phage Camerico]|nr:hypothetical protein SEA_CAMERICO_73 [Gordonia phage Camerico]
MESAESRDSKIYRTHRLFAENIITGQVAMLATGDESFCRQVFIDWLEKIQDKKINPKPGDIMYIAEVDTNLMYISDAQFEYEVLGRPV